MNHHVRNSLPFLFANIVFCVVLGIAIAYFDKAAMHLWLNGTHTAAGDFFFQYYTYVGEWVPYVIMALLLFYKAGWASFLLVDVLVSGGLGQILKYMANTDRPYLFFAKHYPDIQLQLVEGVEMSKWYSFPSGHSTTFFALFMTLTVILCEIVRKNSCQIAPENTSSSHLSPSTCHLSPATCHLSPATCHLLSVVCFLLAVLGGYSRIYLNQHFAEDILGGATIGTLTTFALLFAVPKLEKTVIWNWNLLQIKQKTNNKED